MNTIRILPKQLTVKDDKQKRTIEFHVAWRKERKQYELSIFQVGHYDTLSLRESKFYIISIAGASRRVIATGKRFNASYLAGLEVPDELLLQMAAEEASASKFEYVTNGGLPEFTPLV